MKLLCSISTVYLLLFCLPGCLAAHGRYAQKLMTDLFSNYTNALRPVEDTDHIINVTLQITLSQIIDMDERNQILTTYLWVRQVWNDAYLTWKKEDYDGLDTIRIPSSYVWRPDIVLYNRSPISFFLTGKYYIATMTMVTASTALTIFIMNIHHCGPEARPVPQWAERLILNYLARICFVYEVGENCLGGATSRKQPLSEEESEARAANNSNPKGTNWDVNGQVWAGRVEEDGAGES
ncbi:Neuronal acetylcholine receptor subunit alpha-10 [Dissostichus eleginoides]|uniref:Neuronal acetylcholine receptor subunit alpha-10 n=1 Tax=Dissostichus eleginoides TaxID=100907 RepID=A0AAD9BJB7_DISEL|nr:Neuronal acetylcholine receptor subunit alpha-10 [Dissostichus eleginoides]